MVLALNNSSTGSFVQFLTVFVLFVIVLLICAFTTRFVAGYQKSKMMSGNIHVLETLKIANNKYIQMLVSLGSFSVPIIICRSINALTDSNAGYIIILVAGMASTILHRRWLTFIYRQFMKRRYENLEGFRKTIAN